MTGRCVRSSVRPGFDSVESFFFFFSLLFFSSPLSPRLAFLFFPSFFCPTLISSSPFPLPSFLFFFLLFFSHSFSFFFYFLFPPFCCFSFSLSSLYFIFLISFSFYSPLSFSFFFFFFLRSHKMTTLWFVYSYDRSNWILSTILADYVFCLILYTAPYRGPHCENGLVKLTIHWLPQFHLLFSLFICDSTWEKGPLG